MEKVVLNEQKLILLKENKIAPGSEGIVYDYNDEEVIKIFSTNKSRVLKNKLNKIKRLIHEDINGFVFPRIIVVDEWDRLIGYIMRKVFTTLAIESLYDLMNYPLSIKIEYLNIEEQMLKKANRKGIYNIDLMGQNILIDINGNVNNIDTDNYAVGVYGVDCVSYFLEHYQCNVSNIVDENTVKYNFGLLALEFLLPQIPIYEIIINDVRNGYSSLEELVKRLDIDKYVKDVLRELFSDTREKEYIGDSLKCLSSEDKTCLTLK